MLRTAAILLFVLQASKAAAELDNGQEFQNLERQIQNDRSIANDIRSEGRQPGNDPEVWNKMAKPYDERVEKNMNTLIDRNVQKNQQGSLTGNSN